MSSPEPMTPAAITMPGPMVNKVGQNLTGAFLICWSWFIEYSFIY